MSLIDKLRISLFLSPVMQLSRNASFSSGVLQGVSLSLMSSSWVRAVLSLYWALTRQEWGSWWNGFSSSNPRLTASLNTDFRIFTFRWMVLSDSFPGVFMFLCRSWAEHRQSINCLTVSTSTFFSGMSLPPKVSRCFSMPSTLPHLPSYIFSPSLRLSSAQLLVNSPNVIPFDFLRAFTANFLIRLKNEIFIISFVV